MDEHLPWVPLGCPLAAALLLPRGELLAATSMSPYRGPCNAGSTSAPNLYVVEDLRRGASVLNPLVVLGLELHPPVFSSFSFSVTRVRPARGLPSGMEHEDRLPSELPFGWQSELHNCRPLYTAGAE